MLEDAIKKQIQDAYTKFLAAKELKPRYGQKLMIAHIARTFGNIELNDDGENTGYPNIAVVEAGTGTGKTIAYLLATLPIAAALEKKVVLSTATIALQEQIIHKDLPELLRNSELNFRFALAKGRGRYLCLSKLERTLSDARSDIPAVYEDEVVAISEDDLATYRSMLQRTTDGEWDGDRDNWDDEISTDTWQRVTTDHRQCTGRKCPNIRDCAFFNARGSLEEVSVIVANHDLVLSDLALGGGAILPAPEETIYIFDEGHHLPDKALNHFAAHIRYRATIRWLGQSEGQWPNHLKTVSELTYFSQIAEPIERTLKQARSVLEQGLPYLRSLCEDVDLDTYSPKLQFELGVVEDEFESLAQDASQAFLDLTALLEKMHQEIETLVNDSGNTVPSKSLEAMLALLGSWLTRAEANLKLWQSYRDTKFNEKSPFARWITLVTAGDVLDYEIVSSPVLASSLLAPGLWRRCCGAVVTSATMRALNKFDRFTMKAGLYDNASCEAVPSPFNFTENAVLNVPTNAVEANNAISHTTSVIELIPELVDPTSSTLVLFSSRAQMEQVYDAMPDELQDIILCQGHESKQRMIEAHKRRVDRFQGSVLWGLASFAEGVDLPGDYCKHVVIAKLPFSVPDEPLEAAYSEWITARGGNAFMEVVVPDASTRLIQACGRLLRTEKDSGRISILDKRLISKRYGSAILNALPPFSREF